MAPPLPVNVVFAGPGPVAFENAKALLNDYLGFGAEDKSGVPEYPERELMICVPVSGEVPSGVMVISDWLDYADLAYDVTTSLDPAKVKDRGTKKVLKFAENVDQTPNPEAAAMDWLAEQEGDKFLILAWGEEGDDQAEILLDLADAKGIQALDLTQGLDVLGFGTGETIEDPEPEPEPEPEPAPRARRGRARKPVEEEAPAEEPKAEEKPEPRKRTPRKTAAQKKAEAAPKDDLTVNAIKERVDADNAARGGDDHQAMLDAKAEAEEKKVVKNDGSLAARFQFYPATTTTAPQHEQVRMMCADFATALDALLQGESREKSMVFTKIEEAMFWANAHIARNHESRGPGRPRKGV